MLGGALVGLLAMISPQVLSSGHGALHLIGIFKLPLEAIALIFVLKSIASIISLGAGFRGGLFFASLLLGSFGGKLFAVGLNALWPHLHVDPDAFAIIGMSALSVSVIGGPLTMTFIALETTGDLWLTTAVLIAVIISMQVTREFFGYSFTTWRFHLRGETIRSAADVGWIRDLTVAQMMRSDVRTTPVETPISAFRAAFPLGSTNQVIALDEDGHYAGIVILAEAHSSELPLTASLRDILHHTDHVLLTQMTAQEAIAAFDRFEAEALAVVELDRAPSGDWPAQRDPCLAALFGRFGAAAPAIVRRALTSSQCKRREEESFHGKSLRHMSTANGNSLEPKLPKRYCSLVIKGADVRFRGKAGPLMTHSGHPSPFEIGSGPLSKLTPDLRGSIRGAYKLPCQPKLGEMP